MLTLKRLINNVYQLRSYGFRKANEPTIRKVSPIPILGQLAIQAEVKALTDKKETRYITTIVFHKLEFQLTKSSRASTQVAILPGKNMYMVPPSYSKTPVKISCTCRSYAYDFSYFNGVNGANNTPLSYPPEFKHLLPKGIRNPVHVPGACKHIYMLEEKLYRRGVLRI